MIDFILWYVVITLLGWLSFPISFRLFTRLQDRGFGLSKVLGLLLWAYVFWLLNMLQIGQNTPGGLLLALTLVLVASWVCLRNGRFHELLVWVKEHKRTILFIELVFLGLFAFWTLIRSTNPEVAGTEKPMELAFITSILRSPQFPPHDPWLSGYAISEDERDKGRDRSPGRRRRKPASAVSARRPAPERRSRSRPPSQLGKGSRRCPSPTSVLAGDSPRFYSLTFSTTAYTGTPFLPRNWSKLIHLNGTCRRSCRSGTCP